MLQKKKDSLCALVRNALKNVFGFQLDLISKGNEQEKKEENKKAHCNKFIIGILVSFVLFAVILVVCLTVLNNKENTKAKDDEKSTEPKSDQNGEKGTQDPVAAKQDKKATNGLGSSIAKYGVLPFTSLIVACAVPYFMDRISKKRNGVESNNTGESVDIDSAENAKSGAKNTILPTVEDKQEDKKDSTEKA